MSPGDKPLVWLRTDVKTPPFLKEARLAAGYLLRRLQRSENLTMPHSRPMPGIGAQCHELRIVDGDTTWRIVYRTDSDAVIIVDVFKKKTPQTPKRVIATSKARFREYDDA